MARSLIQQLNYCVHKSFNPGRSKHYDKEHHQGRDRGLIYSYETKYDRLDVVNNFGKFMKEKYPEIKMARDLQPTHFQDYLNDCKERGCTQATLTSRTSHLRALCREMAHIYPTCEKIPEKAIKTPLAVREKIRDHQMPIETRERVLERANGNLRTAMELSKAFGLRSQEITHVRARDIYERDGSIYCHVERGKGNRNREVQALDRERGERCLELVRGLPEQERLVPIKDKSLERSLTRELQRGGEHELHIGFHGLRKTWSQELYNDYRESHSKLETVIYVNEQLGHSGDRDEELLARYVADLH